MSGFVAVVRSDGDAVAADLIERLTLTMAYRGPDRQSCWVGAGAGLGHAAFDTTSDPADAPQPYCLHGRIRIVADARIDDRGGLAGRLRDAGRGVPDRAADVVLLAHAYDCWGERMVEGLLGDFAFVIWDEQRRRLFAARDQMGSKPCYYALAGDEVVVGNTLPAVLAHPAIDDALDEHAIGDFLLFGLNRHPERTSFARIARLPAAHTLRWRAGGAPRVARYWELESRAPLTRSTDECAAAFGEVLETAVADRVRGSRAAVLMSGGVDSTAVAALAHEVMLERYDDSSLQACTFVYERVGGDPEGKFARDAARHIGIPHRCVSLDEEGGAASWADDAAWSAEPNEQPTSARMMHRLRALYGATRVAFTGQGGDPALHVSPADAAHRAAADGWARSAAAMVGFRLRHGSVPRLGLRSHLRRRLGGSRVSDQALLPPWLRADFSARVDLEGRLRESVERRLEDTATRPEAAFLLGGPEWSFWLESCDPGANGFALEYRHPLLDIRLVELALRLPVIPHLVEKHILRQALRHRLPEAVLRRPKAPLPDFPMHRALRERPVPESRLSSLESHLGDFVDLKRFRALAHHPERLRGEEAELVTRPLGLALWLARRRAGSSPPEHRGPRRGTMQEPRLSLSSVEPSNP